MKKHLMCAFLLFSAGIGTVAEAADPLPRFVSLRSDEANLRAGPGVRYPIRWVYRRGNMPVEVIDQYDNWRKIRDLDHEEGWLHRSLLSGNRTALIAGAEARALHQNPDSSSPPVLMAKPMVIGKLLRCEAQWCQININGYKGWMEKSNLWGVYPKEKF